jgi:benzoyl-CoA reductase/2-hydroxyglutaryl-CoA dehydratase subunit BcrC/BadD/HgdB
VADTYTSAWSRYAERLDENNFLESMVEGYTVIYLNISVAEMAKIVTEMIDKYDVDGVVLHSNRSCKPYSLGQYDIQRIIQEERGIPSLILETDMVDERKFSESQIETRIDAFMETIRK